MKNNFDFNLVELFLSVQKDIASLTWTKTRVCPIVVGADSRELNLRHTHDRMKKTKV